MRELDNMAIEAIENQKILDQLISKNESFILRCASTASRRYVTKSDDEWSIAIIAFTQAVQSYRLDKGSFLSFAELIIKRRLVDYFRTQTRYNQEITVNPNVFGSDIEEEYENLQMKLAVSKQMQTNSFDGDSLKNEIMALNESIAMYGFSFFDLVDSSPKSKKTKQNCATTVAYMLSNRILIEELRKSKQLPMKIIEKNTKIPRKIIERHRKYIITATEILYGDYPNLSEYMQFIKDALNKEK